MSGHSHYSTIKRKKEAGDAARGKIFSKLSRAISIAIKTGGGPNPDTNYKLRVAIEAAKAANMPKANIERALSKASESDVLEEVAYEGFGPEGIGVIVETATDNRNRTGQEIKGIFDRGGGRLAGPGAVSYNFEPKGLILVKKTDDCEAQMLKLIDFGVEDVLGADDAIEVYVEPEKLSETKKKLEEKGFALSSVELMKKPKILQKISDSKKAEKVLSFLDKLENLDDVQKVYSNLDIPEEVLRQVSID